MKKCETPSQSDLGFTIVELLVVIVVIGILAAITIVSYSGISQRAKIASLQSDLTNAAQQLKLFQTADSSDKYPETIDCSIPDSTTNKCLKASGSNSFAGGYSYNNTVNPRTFTLDATNGSTVYRITNNSGPVEADLSWIAGIAATAMAGKYVRSTNLSGSYVFKTTNTDIAAPQGATGLDPNYSSNMSLVSPQTYPAVDFSEYSAQNACKAVGGRLPNTQELTAIFAGKITYGNNFSGIYWSATQRDTWASYYVNFTDGIIYTNTKPTAISVRCVKD